MEAPDFEDPLKTCPYDKSHRIRTSRYQTHLLHCRESNSAYKKKRTKVCPYSSFHIISIEDFEDHVENCPYQEKSLIEYEETKHIGSVPLEELNKIYVPPAEENWDEEPPIESYDPLKQARNKGVLLAPVGLSTAKKRAFKRAERQRFLNLEGRNGRSDKSSKSMIMEKSYKTFRSPQRAPAASLPATIRELNECYRKVNEDFEESDDEEPEFHLRPPRTRSIALSTSCNSSYQDLRNSIALSTNCNSSYQDLRNVSTISEMEKNLIRLFDSYLD